MNNNLQLLVYNHFREVAEMVEECKKLKRLELQKK